MIKIIKTELELHTSEITSEKIESFNGRINEIIDKYFKIK